MALPNTDFGAGRPATKAETFGTKTGADTEVVKGLDDIEDVLDKRLETISLFVEKIANYIPKLGGIDHHVKQISGLRIRDSVMPAMREIIDAISLDTEKDELRQKDAEEASDGGGGGDGVDPEEEKDGDEADANKVPDDREEPETMGEAVKYIQEDVAAIRNMMAEDAEGLVKPEGSIDDTGGGGTGGGDEGGKPDKKSKGMMDGIMKKLKGFFGLIKKFLMIGILLVLPLLSASSDLFAGLKQLFMSLFEIFKKLVGIIFETVVPIITQLMTVIIDVINMLMPTIMSLIDTLVPILTTIIEVVMTVIMAVVEAIMPIIQVILDILVPIIQLVLGYFMMIFEVILLPLLENFLIPVIGVVSDIIMFFFDMFIAVFNGILEFVAKIADFFGMGDKVRQFKIEKDESAEKAEDIDFSQDDEAVEAQIQAKQDSGEINKKTADKLRKDKEKFREKQEERRQPLVESVGAERTADIPEALQQDGAKVELIKMDLSEYGLGEVLVDPAAKEDGTYNMYDMEGNPINYKALEAMTFGAVKLTPIIKAAVEGLQEQEAAAAADMADLGAAFGGGGAVSAESLDTAEAQADAAAAGASGGGGSSAMANINSNQNVNATTNNTNSGGTNPTGGRGYFFRRPGA